MNDPDPPVCQAINLRSLLAKVAETPLSRGCHSARLYTCLPPGFTDEIGPNGEVNEVPHTSVAVNPVGGRWSFEASMVCGVGSDPRAALEDDLGGVSRRPKSVDYEVDAILGTAPAGPEGMIVRARFLVRPAAAES